MSLTKIGEKKYCIVRRGKFWSGTGWTTWYEFSLHFDFSSAVILVEKRFYRMTPRPKIETCSKYEWRKKKKAQKKLKQKRLSQKKFHLNNCLSKKSDIKSKKESGKCSK